MTLWLKSLVCIQTYIGLFSHRLILFSNMNQKKLLRKRIRTIKRNALPKTAAIIYSDAKREYFITEEQYITEKNARKEADIISQYFKKIGIKPKLYAGTATLPQRLHRDKPEVALNLVGSVKGNDYLASSIPAILDLLEIPYTGADMLGESLAYNKFLVKKLLEQNGVPVPRYQLFNSASDLLDPTLRFPLISKLNEIHGGVEITKDSVSENEKHLRERIKSLIKIYEQPILVEEFIVGREITCFLLEGLNKKVYLAENIFLKQSGKYRFQSFEDQWYETQSKVVELRKFDDPLLKEYVKKAFDVTRMLDYGKFDVRIDSSGRYFFIDSNSNPYFGPKEIEAPIAIVLELYGVSFIDMLKRLLLNTVRVAEGKKMLPIPGGNKN